MSENKPAPKPNIQPTVGEIEEFLLDQNPHLFNGISNTKRKQILNSLKDLAVQNVDIYEAQIHERFFQGPIPSPDTLQGYADIDPDIAIEILQMAVREQKYNQDRDNKIIDKSFELKKRGQTFALLIALTAIVGGVACILYGQPVAGSIVSGVGLAGLVSQFLRGSEAEQSSQPVLQENKETE